MSKRERESTSEPAYLVVILVDVYGSTEDYGGYYRLFSHEEDYSKILRSTPTERRGMPLFTKEGDFETPLWFHFKEDTLQDFTKENHCVVMIAYMNE